MYESLLDIVGLGTAARMTGQGDVRAQRDSGHTLTTWGAGWTAQAAEEMLYSRQKLSHIYADMLTAGPAGAAGMQTAERASGRRSIDVGLQTDHWKMAYELPLVASLEAVAVGAEGSGVQLVFAIPGSSLYATPTGGSVIYPIRLRALVRDATGETVAELDTLRNFGAPRIVPYDADLLGRIALPLPAGDYTVRMALETPSRGMVSPPRTIHVAGPSAPRIDLSDLALGARSVPLPLREGGDTAWFNPLGRFHRREPLQLFFEVAGVAPQAPYHATMAVLRPGRTEPLLQVEFNTVAGGSPDRVHRQVDIAQLGTGKYILQVTVAAADGGKAVRQRAFTVIQ
jgi:hypothetical protein